MPPAWQDFTQSPQQLADQMGSLYLQVHDAMPMERAASTKAATVLTDLNRCCIDRHGRPILPLRAVSPAKLSRTIMLLERVALGKPPATSAGPKLPVPPPQSLPQPALPVPGKPPAPTPAPGPTATKPSVMR